MKLKELIQHGEDAIKKDDWDSAYQSWKKVSQESPNHPQANLKLGRILLELDQLEEAERQLNKDLELHPNRLYTLTNLAKIAQKQKKWQLAADRWEFLFKQHPDYEWGLQAYAHALRELDMLNKAERFYHMDIAHHPTHKKSYQCLIDIALEKQKTRLAQLRIDQYILRFPQDVVAVSRYQKQLNQNLAQKHLGDFTNFEKAWQVQRVTCIPKFRSIYIRVPKVATTTTLHNLSSFVDNKIYPGLSLRDAMSGVLGKKTSFEQASQYVATHLAAQDYFVFSFVRNPYTRILSAFLDKIQKRRDEFRGYRSALGFKPFGEEEVAFVEFLRRVRDKEVSELDIHFRPQWHLLGFNKSIRYDFIGHLETYDADLNHVLHRMHNKKPVNKLLERRPHATNAAKKLRKYYGVEEQALVMEIYAEDFKYLGYGYSLDVL